ncbi:MAG: prenyltransferase/squalene oxidase repeat-containing protein [Planctomycetota bacterium]
MLLAGVLALVLVTDRDAEPAVQQPATTAESPELSRRELAAREALERGLAYLAAQQAQEIDGSFPRAQAREWAPVGVTALGCLAFLAAGNQPGRGPYGNIVQRAVDYLLAHQDRNVGSPTHGYIASQGDALSRIHGHGFATLVLAEAFGMMPGNERLGTALEAAVRRIEASQSSEGGWDYEPIAGASHEGSTTICLVQALRAAHTAGIHVDASVVARAVDYVHRLQTDEGTFRYRLHDSTTSVALTAAGISTLNMAGTYDAAPIQAGIDAIWRLIDEPRDVRWPDYERLYVAQAFWQLSDTTHFERWWPRELRRVLAAQNTDGSWTNRAHGPAYATAMQCLVLSVPEGLLPIFQR